MSALKIAIAGVNGRMGRVLVEAVNNHPDTVLSGALEHSGSEVLGLDAGFASGLKTGVTISDDVDAVLAQSDVLIDFTRPEPTLKHLQKCVEKGVNIIIGTTGFDDAGKAAIQAAGEKTGVVFAANFSVGVNLTFHILDTVAPRVKTKATTSKSSKATTATKSMPQAAPRCAWVKSLPTHSAATSKNAPFTAAKAIPARVIRPPSVLPPSAQATSSATTPPSSPPTASAWKSPTRPAVA